MKSSQTASTKNSQGPKTKSGTPVISSPMISMPLQSLGRLRREMIWTLGEETTHGIMTRWGLSIGQAESFGQSSARLPNQELGDWQLHESPQSEQIYSLKKSKESISHTEFFGGLSDTPQCWFAAGYLTGLGTLQPGETLYFLETECASMGKPHCVFMGKTLAEWRRDARFRQKYFEEENIKFDLFHAEEQLQLTKTRYQNLFEQSSSAIFIIDPHTGVNLNANVAASDLTGFSKDELLEMTIFDLCHPEEHHRLMADLKQMTSQGKLVDREISLIRKDGLIRIIAHAGKMFNYGGQNVIQSIMRDITDLKISAQKEHDLQNQLQRSERLSSIGRLAAGVAHELKNPLGAIRNAIYYIRNALKDNPVMETDARLKMIMKLAEDEIDASVMIIGELLDFSRVVQIIPRKTSINEMLEKLPSLVQIPENVQLEWDLDVTLPSAMVDPDRLNQVFCNMVSNACQAMGQGGTLRIKTGFIIETSGEAGVNQEFIVVGFEDTGSGIDPIHLSKIFEPLFTTKARGTGLGLAISRNIVEKHGGIILVKSQKGKGTTFSIKLPLQPPAEKEASS